MAREADKRSAELSVWLSEWIAEHRSSLGKVRRRLGRWQDEATCALQRGGPLRLGALFAVLAGVGQRWFRFFERNYPLGGRRRTAAEERRGWAEDPVFREVVPQSMEEQPRLTPAKWAEETARLLRRSVARAGLRQRAVGLALGLPAQVQGRFLGRPAELTTWHVFGVLAAIGMRPGRFFAELFWPRTRDTGRRKMRAELLDALDHLLAGPQRTRAKAQRPAERGRPRGAGRGNG